MYLSIGDVLDELPKEVETTTAHFLLKRACYVFV